MFPIRNESKNPGIPVTTILLVIACVSVYVVQLRNPELNGLVPLDFVHAILHPDTGIDKAGASLLMSFFLHGSILHLLSNMWYLWIFGAAAECSIGAISFTGVYLLCGILSMIIQVASSPLSTIPIVGASGAIAGIMGLNLVFLPMARILVWIPPIFVLRIPAFVFLLLWFIIQYLSLTYEDPQSGGVAWWAHIGGYASGFLFALILRTRTKGKRQRKS